MIDEDEFYKRRGDRSRQLADTFDYSKVSTGVFTNKKIASTYEGQVMLISTVNLLARWARTIQVDIPDITLCKELKSNTHNRLQDRIITECKEADPYCDIKFETIDEGVLTLQIGNYIPESPKVNYCISVDGWDALLWDPNETSYQKHSTSPSFIPAAQMAACLGTAQLFKIATNQSESDLLDNIRWSLWDYTLKEFQDDNTIAPTVPTNQHVQKNILQVGIGAVGSNVLYFLSMIDRRSNITFLDYDKVEVENLDRSLLYGISNAWPTEEKKVKAAKKNLKKIGLNNISIYDGMWNEFVEADKLNQRDYDVWIASANENNVWQSMAQNLPPLVIQATTNNYWGITMGRHIPFQDYCLRCRFKPDDHDVQTICSKGEVEIKSNSGEDANSIQVNASLPFLSAGAAALIVSELMKLEVERACNIPNYIAANLKSNLPNVIRLNKTPKSDCPVCSRRSLETWKKLNAGSQYSNLVTK